MSLLLHKPAHLDTPPDFSQSQEVCFEESVINQHILGLLNRFSPSNQRLDLPRRPAQPDPPQGHPDPKPARYIATQGPARLHPECGNDKSAIPPQPSPSYNATGGGHYEQRAAYPTLAPEPIQPAPPQADTNPTSPADARPETGISQDICYDDSVMNQNILDILNQLSPSNQRLARELIQRLDLPRRPAQPPCKLPTRQVKHGP
ncbi:MAG: hypothetical protein ISS52_07665 [Dehalococcoidia bacterium]|nr:hypothetical protein [Dehalococcoidia bacterium]